MKFKKNGDHISDQIINLSLQKKTVGSTVTSKITPRSTLRMVRQLGREPGQVKAWQKTHSPDSFQRTTSSNLFTDYI